MDSQPLGEGPILRDDIDRLIFALALIGHELKFQYAGEEWAKRIVEMTREQWENDQEMILANG